MIKLPEEDYGEESVESPLESVLHRAEAMGLKPEQLKAPEHVLLSLNVNVTERLVRLIGGEPLPWVWWARKFHIGRIADTPAGVVWAASGAPLAVQVMEELIACGAKAFIGVGSCRGVHPSVHVGDIIIPTIAVRDEGTSYHYLLPEVEVAPSERLLEALHSACRKLGIKPREGPIWTTDAPYRETKSKIEYLARQGVLGVEMETAAIFALASCRKVETGCVLWCGRNIGLPSPETAELTARIAVRAIEEL